MDLLSFQSTLGERYAIEQELDRNEFLARDPSGARWLLQIVAPGRSDDGGRRTLGERLARVAALEHAHLLPVEARGEACGAPYLVRPVLDSAVSLRTWLEREPALPFLEAVRVLRETADALRAIHAAGLAHGALRVESILWHETHAKVKDLGLAPPRPPADDLRAFGALAYEVLTGTPPAPRRPRAVNALRHHHPPGLARLVMRCLDEVPAARPSAEEIFDRLECLVTPAPGYRARHLLAQAEYLARRGDPASQRGARDRFRRAAELAPDSS